MDAQIFLEKWVLQDGKPITARLLSLLQECHISEAHKAMSQFEKETKNRDATSRPFVSWILKGILKADVKATSASQQSMDSMDVDDDGSETINEGHLLVTEEQLQEAKSRFEQISLKQIYSFSPAIPKKATKTHKVAALSQLTTIQHEIHNNKDYISVLERTDRGAKLGTIRSAKSRVGVSKISLSNSVAGPSNSNSAAKVSSQIQKEAAKAKIEKKVEVKNPSATTKESLAKPNSNSKSKRKLVESEDEDEKEGELKRASRAVEEKNDDSDEGPIGYADKEEKPKASDKAKVKAGANRKRADASDAASADEEKKRKRKQELMDMMDEDEDEGGQADPAAIEPSENTSTSMMKGNEAKEESAGIDEKVEEEAIAPKRRIRKQRKVIRKEKTKDSKGYTRTQDVEAYESYSSEESNDDNDKSKKESSAKKRAPVAATVMTKGNSDDGGQANPPASKKPINTSSTNTNGGGGGGQRKLSSFFSKGNKN